jgi:hypothetical protein
MTLRFKKRHATEREKQHDRVWLRDDVANLENTAGSTGQFQID